MFTDSEINKIQEEITLKGTKHPCFKGYLLYFPNKDEYLAKRQATDEIEFNAYSRTPEFAHLFKTYQKAFLVSFSFTSLIHITQLFDINNKFICVLDT